MIGNTALRAVILCLCIFASVVAASDAPPLPEGYADDQAVMTAILLGRLKLIDARNVATPDGVEEILDVEYGTGGQRKLKLDLYLPRGRTEATPAVIFIHGGAWKTGQRSDMKFYCAKFAEKGYVTATVTYRLLGEAPFPAAVHDVKCAVRWLRANAAKCQVDPARIAVSGNSAGGHLALMVGYADNPSLEGTGGNNDVSSRVCAVVDFYGPTNLTDAYARNQEAVADFLGGRTFAEAPDLYRLASPLSHLTADDPPTLIFHGTIDSLVPVAQADRLAERLKELGIDSVYERYEGWPHVMDLAEAVNRRCVFQMEQFFEECFSRKVRESAASLPRDQAVPADGAEPAVAQAGAYDPLAVSGRGSGETLDLVVHDQHRQRSVPVLAYLPEKETPAPVVLFSHGLGGSRKGCAYLGRHWSLRGYVAVFLQHPGSDESVWRDVPLRQRMEAMRRAANGRNFLLRAKDIPAVLDQLEQWNTTEGHTLAGRLDLARVGVSGHSFGAVTTQAVSGQSAPGGARPFTDVRIKAALVLSPSGPRRGSTERAFAQVEIPWMLMTGTKDVASIGDVDLKSRLAVFPALPPGGKYELVLHDAEHSAFTERALPGDTEPRNPSHHRVILALSTAFWDAWLCGNADARAWLDGDGPASILEEKDRWQTK